MASFSVCTDFWDFTSTIDGIEYCLHSHPLISESRFLGRIGFSSCLVKQKIK